MSSVMSSMDFKIKRAKGNKVMGVTYVFWNMDEFLVPRDVDSHLVRPCIKELLEFRGYEGELRIAAFGNLSDIPRRTLKGVYHSGIDVTHVPKGHMIMVNNIYSVIGMGDSSCLPSGTNIVALYKIQNPFYVILPTGIAFHALVIPPAHGFGNLIAHLTSEEHLELALQWLPKPSPPPLSPPPVTFHPSKPTTEIVDKAVTAVFWDISNSPIPTGFDPRLAGTYIRHYLKNRGFTGPITITAVGLLTAEREDVKRGLYSSGIRLTHVRDGGNAIQELIVLDFTLHHPGPANIFVIAEPNSIHYYPDWRYYYAYRSSTEVFVGGPKNLVEDKSVEWVCTICSPDHVFQDSEDFTKHLSGIAHEHKMLDTCGEWVCTICDLDLVSQGFANFTNHFSGRAHERKMLDDVPQYVRLSKKQPLDVRLSKKQPLDASSYHGFGSIACLWEKERKREKMKEKREKEEKVKEKRKMNLLGLPAY